MSTLQFHEIANVFPLIEGREFDELVADVRQYGIREPVVLFQGKILDGRNRYRASVEAGVVCPTMDYEGDDPVGFVVSLNLRRRHLNESQRAMVAAKIANLERGRPNENPPIGGISQPEAASMLNVSERAVQRATVVRDQGVAELQDKVVSGSIAVSTAADVARLPQAEQKELVAKGEREILEAAKQIREQRAEQNRVERARIKAEPVLIPSGKYSTIIIDPPWDMQKIERDVRPNQVGFDYPPMSEPELAALDLGGLADDDCHMFCWTTHKFLPMALRLIEGWGWRYVLTMVWHKPGGFQPIGLPQYNCEFAVYARRGSPAFVDTKQFFACFEAPRREHSRKPDEFYDVVRRVTAGTRLDMFSREKRDGFDQYGNEPGRFAA